VVLRDVGVVALSPGGRRGPNWVHGLGGGLRARLQRPLLVAPCRGCRRRRGSLLPPLPELQVQVEIPELSVALTDSDYSLMLSVLAANFSEPGPPLPAGLAALNRK
ncbi:hypothetical protein HaLaN_32285, partial [Haematococcus lacustris]